KGDAYKVFNLGTGIGYSVLDLVNAFEKAAQTKINYRFAPRRGGDIAECWSDPSRARRELGWQATRTIEEMMRDTWNWQKNNPNGYRSV
ncbi:TPA: GDP-mannose 4,6-dehydratase, partial [Escherichia coli]